MDIDRAPVRRMAAPLRPAVDPAGWSAGDVAAREDWRCPLGPRELDDLAAMARRVRGGIGDDPDGLIGTAAEDFDLGAAGQVVERVRRALVDGLGFAVLTGLPVDRWDRLDLAIVYWAIGRHLGRPVSNNPEGDLIGHVTDLGKSYDDPRHRGYQTSAAMDYHMDQCDIVALLCLRAARAGGLSKIVSSVTVHNEMVRRRPDLAALLTEPMFWSRMAEIGPGQKPWYTAPVFNYTDGFLSVTAGPQHILKGHALPETPDLTPAQAEAIAVLEEICEERHLAMEFRPGDVQILNNHVMLHTRTGYEDWPEPGRRRMLWRLWLSAPDIRPRTPFFRNWSDGVRVHDTVERIDLTC